MDIRLIFRNHLRGAMGGRSMVGKSKVSDGRSVRVGLVGPKPRPKGVGDGHPVNIPEPPEGSDGGTQHGRPARYWIRVLSL